MLNRVRAEVAEAYARTHARYAQIETNESAIKSGLLSFTQDLTRIRYRSRDVLPIELLDSFRLMAGARIDYVDAIVDYNRARSSSSTSLWDSPRPTPWRIRSPPQGVAPPAASPAPIPGRPKPSPPGAPPSVMRLGSS